MAKQAIRLHTAVGNSDLIRLEMFAGRYLSEREFDMMQEYVDARCDQLLLRGAPGILHGLEVSLDKHGDSTTVHISPGAALGADGRVVRAFFPASVDWASVLENFQAGDTSVEAAPGLYFLTVRRRVTEVDLDPHDDPCSRAEPDPLRDSRKEVGIAVNLQTVALRDSLSSDSQAQAASRILARFVQESPFDAETGAVPLALVKIDERQLPEWIDVLAGRFPALPDAGYRAMRTHWDARVARGEFAVASEPGSEKPLVELFDMAYLPAAGALPDGLITRIAGEEDSANHAHWHGPTLHFRPQGLRIDLLPVPVNDVESIIERESPRGVVHLGPGSQERLRVMVAVADANYRHDLMDLPDIDYLLIDELYRRQRLASNAFNEWANQFDSIYFALDDGLTWDADREKTENIFAHIYKTTGPVGDFPNLQDAAARRVLGLRPAQSAPQPVVGEGGGGFLPQLQPPTELRDGNSAVRPYSEFGEQGKDWPSAPAFLPVKLERKKPDQNDSQREDAWGLYKKRLELKANIESLRESLEESADMVSDTSDFTVLQRQHFDSISVSFAALAGGVAGDGSGMDLTRWLSSVKIGQKSQDGNSGN